MTTTRKPAALVTITCGRCGGRGIWDTRCGTCFACGGSGTLTIAASTVKARARRAAKAAAEHDAAWLKHYTATEGWTVEQYEAAHRAGIAEGGLHPVSDAHIRHAAEQSVYRAAEFWAKQ